MEPLDFGGAKQCQTIALLMGVAHPHEFAGSDLVGHGFIMLTGAQVLVFVVRSHRLCEVTGSIFMHVLKVPRELNNSTIRAFYLNATIKSTITTCTYLRH